MWKQSNNVEFQGMYVGTGVSTYLLIWNRSLSEPSHIHSCHSNMSVEEYRVNIIYIKIVVTYRSAWSDWEHVLFSSLSRNCFSFNTDFHQLGDNLDFNLAAEYNNICSRHMSFNDTVSLESIRWPKPVTLYFIEGFYSLPENTGKSFFKYALTQYLSLLVDCFESWPNRPTDFSRNGFRWFKLKSQQRQSSFSSWVKQYVWFVLILSSLQSRVDRGILYHISTILTSLSSVISYRNALNDSQMLFFYDHMPWNSVTPSPSLKLNRN